MKLLKPPTKPRFNPRLIRAVLPVARWLGEHYFDAQVRGLERIPDAPALLVGNHNAGMASPDLFIFYDAYARHRGVDDLPVGLAHEKVFLFPVVRQLLRAAGAISAHPEGAHRALESGRKVMVYPGGDWEALRPSSDRDIVDFGGRTGFVRLAMEAGVPIVPIVAAGAHDGWYVVTRGDQIADVLGLDKLLRLETFPIAFALPTGIVAGPINLHIPLPHPIIVEVCDPISVDGDPTDEEAVRCGYDLVRWTMQEKLDALVAELPNR